MKRKISRRKFLTSAASFAALLAVPGTVLSAIAPDNSMKLDQLLNLSNLDPRASNSQPYWIKVLANGVSYIPPKLKKDMNSLSDPEKKRIAYQTLLSSLKLNTAIFSGQIPPTTENMNFLVDTNKQGQYLLESIKGKYAIEQEMPEISHQEDPLKARLFNDFSLMMLGYIRDITQSNTFSGFTDFEISFIQSSASYLMANIEIIESAIPVFSKSYRKEFNDNLGCAYNSYGFALNLLGKIDDAMAMYKKALIYLPEEIAIIDNMKEVHNNASYFHMKPTGT